MPAPTTPNESLQLVGGSLFPSTCDASSNDPQRVIRTRWRLTLPLRLRHQLQQRPTSHYDSLEALSPPPPATQAPTTPNESLQLVRGSRSPCTCDASSNDPQRVITTCWRLTLPLHLRRQLQRPSTSHYDSLEALSLLPPATPAPTAPTSHY